MHHHGTDGRWHMSYGIKLVLSLIYEDYILTCISNQIPLYSTRCNYLFMPNYVNDLTMQQILACLQSPIAFSLLAKIFNFDKYVRLTVCLFVCLFVTCQNFQFLQVCSFVRLSVCLSVCLSVTSSIQVTVFYISLPNLTQVCIYVT